ncbi:PP2C family protein-serine/threonine phosphatase [Crossiella sp. CA198]|uniref:PP2C family protein-serine/threonine phosphatase n=1 Tax=Crossiella sp. CA198 TaxID=3455607 RepID=UPI003F8D79AA
MTDPHQQAPLIRVAMATRRGIRENNMDAAAAFESSRGLLAAAVVDGIGNHAYGPETMRLCAVTAARISTTRGTMAGVLAAAGLIEDPGVEEYRPNAVAVVALAEAGEETDIAWVGDSHAYSWDGTRLHRRTTPHTMGEFLRQNGDIDLAPEHDNWVRVSLTTATPTNIARAAIPAGELVLLLSDGLDGVPAEELTALVQQHQDNPEALADALVEAARADEDGYRDDATAIVLAALT